MSIYAFEFMKLEVQGLSGPQLQAGGTMGLFTLCALCDPRIQMHTQKGMCIAHCLMYKVNQRNKVNQGSGSWKFDAIFPSFHPMQRLLLAGLVITTQPPTKYFNVYFSKLLQMFVLVQILHLKKKKTICITDIMIFLLSHDSLQCHECVQEFLTLQMRQQLLNLF